ncbi:ATP-binding protein [Pendulispora brunnea]|uniref:ATP-binding protein n=1 Tax=Pendulispora brunnea TaxID=2905690 RepID=A0ABZ2KE07_9BACT
MKKRTLDQARELATRDAFLRELTRKLTLWIGDAERCARRRKAHPEVRRAMAGLLGTMRELHVIANPKAPITLRRRRLDLVSFLPRYLAEWDRLDVHVQGRASLIGHWDRGHLGTLLMELLSNAFKYGRGKEVTITMGARGKMAILLVRSHGTLARDLRGHFARFRRGRGLRAPGFGIGVWLARKIAKAHGGAFRLRSDGSHTVARVALPLTHATGDVASVRFSLVTRP